MSRLALATLRGVAGRRRVAGLSTAVSERISVSTIYTLATTKLISPDPLLLRHRTA